jgi:hypothetical protein
MNVAIHGRQRTSQLAPRKCTLLTAPVLPTLMRLAAPNLGEAAARITFLTADAAFVSWLGGSALAAVTLVYPLFLIIQTFTASGFGTGVSASVGQVLGAGDRAKACQLANAALILALAATVLSTCALLLFAPWLHRLMGGRGEVLQLATVYGRVLLSGIGFVWLMNLLANVSRGAGNMIVPASAIFVGEACHLLLSPALILGLGAVSKAGHHRRSLRCLIRLCCRLDYNPGSPGFATCTGTDWLRIDPKLACHGRADPAHRCARRHCDSDLRFGQSCRVVAARKPRR